MDRAEATPSVGVGIRDARYEATAERPFRFGREATSDGFVGLDRQDMRISARAGAIEYEQGVWWVTNLSAKRSLLLDLGAGSPVVTLSPAQRHAIASSPLGVLVRGANITHRIEVVVPTTALARHRASHLGSSGTIVGDDLHLTAADRAALAAVFSPLLRAWPRRSAHPLTYQEAADMLGGKWTKTSVRKHVEKVRERLAEADVYFEGSLAKYELGQHLLDNNILTTADLSAILG
ncbi:MAG: hypothetical protein M3N98_15370 [Actinomycetota bacterium]|nr:hypothetical protein [Actinomycetota bacterium]